MTSNQGVNEWLKLWQREHKDTMIITKADYENRLKADMVTILTDLQLEIKELETGGDAWELAIKDDCKDIIQQKINSLKEA